MPLPAPFDRLRLPVIGSPLFIVSGPELVIAQCKAGIIGSFPALNARPQTLLDEWLHQITEELAKHNRENPDRPAAPFRRRAAVIPHQLEGELATQSVERAVDAQDVALQLDHRARTAGDEVGIGTAEEEGVG